MTAQPLLLEAAKKPENIPTWLTQEYFEQCGANQELQKGWKPKVGDWYFCKDLYQIAEITDLEAYYSSGISSPLPTDHGKDSRGRWGCDIYIPEPPQKEVNHG